MLRLTGERTLPGVEHENYWFRRHEAAYLALASACPAGRVLDAGCGEGYGAALLAQRAGADVVALDYDPPSLAHVRARYPGTRPVRANLVALPFADASFDAVVSLQVVEHLWDQDRFVAECVRVLRPGGTLVLSTPNRLTFSPPGAPANPFHARELAPDELRALVAPRVTSSRMSGLHHGPRLRAWEERQGPLTRMLTATPPESWEPAVHALVASVRADDFVLRDARPSEIASSLDLVLTARR